MCIRDISNAAAKRVNEKFSWSKTAESYIATIDKIVSIHQKSLGLNESILDCDDEIKAYLKKNFL